MGGQDVPGERSSDPEDLLPLTPVALNVLLALADGERHGYAIMLEVRERTGGRVRLGPGTLYGAIKRLKEGGVIEESKAEACEAWTTSGAAIIASAASAPRSLRQRSKGSTALVRAARRKGAFPAPKPSPEGA